MRRTPRDYQAGARDAIWAYFADGGTGHPVVALPTGTGKSLVQADFTENVVKTWPGQRFLLLAPSKELIEQNVEALLRQWPGAPVGIVSASLSKREFGRPITYGTVGSLVRHTEKIGHIDIVFVDECHLVSDKESSQYRKLIDKLLDINPNLKVIGLSATPYRLGVGHIIEGGLFTDVCYDATTLQAFNWFIEQGYLVPLVPRATRTKLDTDGVKLQGGEFNQKQLQAAVDQLEVTEAAIGEALELAHDREHCLVFATGIEHAEHIAAMLEARGESAVVIHSKMPDAQRDENLEAFKKGEVRWCVNNNVLTTGFDFPGLDCIVMLRPTKSPGLWVQMLGRGTRPDYAEGFDLSDVEGRLAAIQQSGKQNCLVLDFAGNTMEMGPINDPQLPRKKGKGGGMPPFKLCKTDNTVDKLGGCGTINHPTAKFCIDPYCGAEFIFDVKISATAGDAELLAFEKPVVNEYHVTKVVYERHSKAGRPDSIKVTYYVGLRRFTHYVCPEHGGIPTRKAGAWWMRHGGGTIPESTTECLKLVDELTAPYAIKVWENKKYPEIQDWIFNEQHAPA